MVRPPFDAIVAYLAQYGAEQFRRELFDLIRLLLHSPAKLSAQQRDQLAKLAKDIDE